MLKKDYAQDDLIQQLTLSGTEQEVTEELAWLLQVFPRHTYGTRVCEVARGDDGISVSIHRSIIPQMH